MTTWADFAPPPRPRDVYYTAINAASKSVFLDSDEDLRRIYRLADSSH